MTTIRSRELERMLARVEAGVSITTDVWEGHPYAAVVADMPARPPALRHRVVLGETVRDDEIDFVAFFQEKMRAIPAAGPTDPDAVALVLFTSGTTGEPKAALQTRNTLYAQTGLRLFGGSSSSSSGSGNSGGGGDDGGETKLYRFTPQSSMHAAGMVNTMIMWITGGAGLQVERWEPRRVARLSAETGMEGVFMVPPQLAALLAVVREDGIRLPRLRTVLTGGIPVSSELAAETEEVSDLPLQTPWGMTEGGRMSTAPDDPPGWAARSIGRPRAGTEVELRPAAAGAPVDEENPGRLMIRGASLCLGTLGRDSGGCASSQTTKRAGMTPGIWPPRTDPTTAPPGIV